MRLAEDVQPAGSGGAVADPGLVGERERRAVQGPSPARADDLQVEAGQGVADGGELPGRDGDLQVLMPPRHLAAEQVQRPAARHAPPGRHPGQPRGGLPRIPRVPRRLVFYRSPAGRRLVLSHASIVPPAPPCRYLERHPATPMRRSAKSVSRMRRASTT
ncbi:MAG TPA: hypothetical protein VMU94_01020 [Streptosporangiaceae bacterium]|nr:hypothetical protein [Streptosporangiaceae bacterium]